MGIVRGVINTSIVTAAGLAGAAVAGLAGADHLNANRRPNLEYSFTPFELGLADAVDDVRFAAADGTALAGWWFRNPDARDVIICAHGWRGSKSDMLGIGPMMWRAGAEVLLFDFRGNGESADGPQSLGFYEQQDLQAAVDFAAERRPDARIHLVGYSMGAATSILVAAADSRVASVVADSPFGAIDGVIAHAAESMRLPFAPIVHLPGRPVARLVDRMGGLRYGYRFGQVRPVDIVDQIEPRPLMIVHGTKDSVIPVAETKALIKKAGPHATLRIVEGADHCGAYFADRIGYPQMVADFFGLTGDPKPPHA